MTRRFYRVVIALLVVNVFIFQTVMGSAMASSADDSQLAAIKYRIQGYMYQRKGRYSEALAMYKRSADAHPFYACVHNDLGILYEQKGLLEKAEKEYLLALELDPDYILAHTNLALLYENRNQLKDAHKHWTKRASLGKPSDPWTLKARERKAYLDILFTEEIKAEQEKEDKRKAKKEKIKQKEAKRAAKKAAKKAGKKRTKKAKRKDSKRRKKRAKKPIKIDGVQDVEMAMALQMAQEIAAQKQALMQSRSGEFNSFYKQGLKLYRTGDYESALMKFHKAAELNPTSKKAKGYIQKCIDKIEDRKKRKQRKIENNFRKGQKHYLNKKYNKALTCFKEVANLNPNYPNIQNLIQEVQQAKEKAKVESKVKAERKKVVKAKRRRKKAKKVKKPDVKVAKDGRKLLAAKEREQRRLAKQKEREQSRLAKQKEREQSRLAEKEAKAKRLAEQQRQKALDAQRKAEETRRKARIAATRKIDGLMEKAQDYSNRQKYALAVKTFQKVKVLDPNFPDIDNLIKQAKTMIKTADEKKEEQRLRRSAERDFNKAKRLYRDRKYQQAADLLENVLAANPSHYEARRTLRYCERRLRYGSGYMQPYEQMESTAHTAEAETEPPQIKIYPELPAGVRLMTGSNKNYEILGVVAHRSEEKNIDALNEELFKKGKLQGANYIIQIRYFEHGGYLYGYGTAVKLKRR